MLVCPHCGSNYLTIKRRAGFELLMMYFTNRRKYLCMGCGHGFRASDRRKVPRAAIGKKKKGGATP